MIHAADKNEFEPALAGDGLDHTERTLQSVQNRPLLDVKFHEAERVALQSSFGNLARVQAEVLNRLPDANAIFVLAAQQFVIETSHKRAASDERRSETLSFFLGKADHFDSKWQPLTVQCLKQSHAKNHSQNAIERSGVGHCIEMRSN